MSAPIVIKLGGAAIDEGCERTFGAIARLHRSEPGGVIVVHGGGKIVDRRLARLGIVSEKRDGVRITPPEHMAEIVATLAGVVNATVVGGLQRAGANPVGLTLNAGGTTVARVASKYSFNPGRVGEVAQGDDSFVRALLAHGFLPVFSSIGADAQGQPLNINADDAAAALAGVAGARALFLLTDAPGILDAHASVIERIDPAGADRLIDAGEITGGMIAKVRGALDAAAHSGAQVVIAGAADPDNLLALAQGNGVGTRVAPAHAVTAPHRPARPVAPLAATPR